MKKKMSFEDFVDWIQMSSDTCIHPSPKKNQLDWFTDKSGTVLVDFIGKFETLQEDWDSISKTLHITKPLPHLKKRKASATRHYTEYYDSKTKEIIREKFVVDIEYFGYTFDT